VPDEPPSADPAALAELTQTLRRTAPRLAGARVQRVLGCLRTFAVRLQSYSVPPRRSTRRRFHLHVSAGCALTDWSAGM
jgi:hypothetical protein